MMPEQRKPWFRIKGSGYGLTPTTWQGWCLTLVIMAMLLASVQVVLYLVHDPLNAVILILVVTGIELAVFIPFTYRHAESSEEAEKAEASRRKDAGCSASVRDFRSAHAAARLLPGAKRR